jgi:nucleobase:cation symporter-1, NCS1 family
MPIPSQYVQLFIIPVAFTLASFCGIMVTSAGIVLYGKTLWDPLTLIDHWDNRAAAFFTAFSFMLGTLGTNISANSLSAANDMTVLFPRYINIRRGQIICAIVAGWALAPWEILASAQGFLTFMSGYTVFLGPFAGIMVTDVGFSARYVIVNSGFF